MRPLREVLSEVEHAAARGHREVHLLGQIVNHYQAPDEPSCDFAVLLRRVSEVAGIDRIRFASPHPRHVTEAMMDAMAELPKVARHLHLPVQSGSSRVLASMRRRHTREEYLALAGRLKVRVPGIRLSTDLIVGFPGETEADFDETLSLVEQVRFHSIFSFKYSTRPNTLAAKRLADDVAEPDKTRRIVALQARQKEIELQLHREMLGTQVEVLVDGESRRGDELSGRTSGNTVVNLPGPSAWVGRMAAVRIARAGANSLSGTAISVEGVGCPEVETWAARGPWNGRDDAD